MIKTLIRTLAFFGLCYVVFDSLSIAFRNPELTHTQLLLTFYVDYAIHFVVAIICFFLWDLASKGDDNG